MISSRCSHSALSLGAFLLTAVAQAQMPPDGPRIPVPRDSLDAWIVRLSNAGRWGPEDELGTLNFITPSVRRRAASTVRDGISVSLAHELVPGPNPRAIGPLSMRFLVIPADSVVTWAVDSTTVLYHGWAYSHIDALSHTAWRGQMYNRFGLDQFSSTGTKRLGIQAMHRGIATRAVLFDIPRLLGVPYLEPGTVITEGELDRWARQHRLAVEPGDVVLIRTGRWAREKALGTWDVTAGAAGPHPALAAWLRRHDVAALGGDVSNEFYPSLVPGVSDPLHELLIVSLGMPLMDNLDLEEVAETAAARARWTFLLMAAPLRIRGATGSLLNALAVF